MVLQIAYFHVTLELFCHTADSRGMQMVQGMYLALALSGYLLSYLLLNPWFLLISLYLAPALRFGSLRSFSLGICDCTFNTEDGGLHMAGGSFLYFLISPILLPVMLMKTLRSKP
jgi:hypothetical protein